MSFLSYAHQRFAVGLVRRELPAPCDNSDYPRSTATGDLPYLQRKLGLFVTKVASDMAALTLLEDERLLHSMNRRLKMLTRGVVHASLKLFSTFMRGALGMRTLEWYLQRKALTKPRPTWKGSTSAA